MGLSGFNHLKNRSVDEGSGAVVVSSCHKWGMSAPQAYTIKALKKPRRAQGLSVG